MRVEWTIDDGSVDIDPADYKGMSSTAVRREIQDLCMEDAKRTSVHVLELDKAVAAVVEALKGQKE